MSLSDIPESWKPFVGRTRLFPTRYRTEKGWAVVQYARSASGKFEWVDRRRNFKREEDALRCCVRWAREIHQ